MPERANQIERRGNNIPLSTESIWYCRHKQKSIKETAFLLDPPLFGNLLL